MTSDNKLEGEGVDPAQQGVPPNNAADNSAAGVPHGGAHDAAAEASQSGQGNDELSRLKAEAADLKDRLLRAHAEMENVRKRLEKEKADTARFAITKFARDVVGIGDNVQRAIDAVPHKAAEHDPSLKSFLEGVTMIEREFINVLDRHGVKRIDPKGEAFNPHLHQAVMEMPVPDVPSGTVTQVFQPGYMIEDRVLRPAMVVVAKGGMKSQATAEGTAGADTPTTPGAEAGASNENGRPAGDASGFGQGSGSGSGTGGTMS